MFGGGGWLYVLCRTALARRRGREWRVENFAQTASCPCALSTGSCACPVICLCIQGNAPAAGYGAFLIVSSKTLDVEHLS